MEQLDRKSVFGMGQKFNLTWQTFSSHGQQLFKNLFETQEFTDVTLISDDLKQYRVHKFILSSCSTVFRKILTSNSLQSSIYLRGIHHKELESILQFIYLGEATFYHERINEFINVAKDLEIKDIINKDIVVEDQAQAFDSVDEIKNMDEVGQVENNSNDVNVTETKIPDCDSVSYYVILGDKRPYQCQQCDYKATHKHNILHHVQKKHEGIDSGSFYSFIRGDKKPYQCLQCDYKATHKHNLLIHVQNKHDGIKYPCQHCDYKATQPDNLRQHMRYKHEGIKYPCQQCDYQATTAGNLQIHVRAKHEGAKYPCQQCDYQATQASNLHQHVKSKH